MKQEDDLKALGLNKYESSVYVALLGGGMKAKELAVQSGVPQPRVYDVLRSLASLGFVQESGGVFRAVRPSVALGIAVRREEARLRREMGTKEDAARGLIEGLEPLYAESQEARETTTLKGMEGIASAFAEVLARDGDVYLIVRKALVAKAPFLQLLSESPRPGLSVRILVPEGADISSQDARTAKRAGIGIRRYEEAMLDVMVGGVDDVIIGVPARGVDESFGAVAIWVRDGSFAASLRQTARAIWQKSSPLR